MASSTRAWLIGGGIAVIVAVLVVVGIIVIPPIAHSARAVVLCEYAVKDKLKAPATAQFSSEHAEAIGDKYTVTGNVDAQNSFGALVRDAFQCTVTGEFAHVDNFG